MHFTYCPDCGEKTTLRVIGDEGAVPYCTHCDRPLFDLFPTCVLSVLVNAAGEIALIRQSYGQQTYFVGVSGYMKPGETAEQAAARELTEEIGIAPQSLTYRFSAWHESGGQLMLCFSAFAEKTAFTLSDEVATAQWFSPKEALGAVRPGSIIARLTASVCADMNKS